MRLIENINSLIRFVGYLLPLFILVFGKGIIWKIINKLKWHQELVFTVVYYGLLILATLFAIVAIYKLFRYSNKRKARQCQQILDKEIKIRIANLAEQNRQIEQFFADNIEWLGKDLDCLLTDYSKAVNKIDFSEFVNYCNAQATVYFSHRVTNRKQFINILNKL